MKKFSLILLTLLIGLGAEAQVYPQGTHLVTLGYGFPNSVALQFDNVSVNDDFQRSVIGPAYLKYEYIASKVVSVGIQLAFSKVDIDYGIEYVDNQQLFQGREGCEITNFAAYTDINFYWLRAGRLAMYSGVGIGYNYINYKEYSDDPFFNNSIFSQSLNNAIPIGGQLNLVGAKFEISNSFGFYSQMSLGKSLFEFGFCYGFARDKNNIGE
jgi:hypothetical protein